MIDYSIGFLSALLVNSILKAIDNYSKKEKKPKVLAICKNCKFHSTKFVDCNSPVCTLSPRKKKIDYANGEELYRTNWYVAANLWSPNESYKYSKCSSINKRGKCKKYEPI